MLARHADKVDVKALAALNEQPFATSGKLQKAIDAALPNIDYKTQLKIIDDSLVEQILVDPAKFKDLEKTQVLDAEQFEAVQKLGGKTFTYRWELVQALADSTPKWKLKEQTVLNKPYNKEIQKDLEIVMDLYTPKMK